jgi:cyclophilin family peptidyl-prolyl cis-trans isomerase
MNKKNKKTYQIISIVLVVAMLLTMGIVSIPLSIVGGNDKTDLTTLTTEDIQSEPIVKEEPLEIVETEEEKIEFTTDTSSYVAYEQQVVIETEKGNIVVELYPEIAPKTVENFVNLVNSGFYDGLTFHRVIKDFMIQTGDPNGDGTGGSEENVVGEFLSNDWKENNLSHTEGVISMARATDKNSASSQFFICTAEDTFLDGEYAAFGKVIEGLDVAKEISNVETNETDKPLEDIHTIKIYLK